MSCEIEHPILFSTAMIKAILDGKKSMTRRIIKSKTLDKFINLIWNPNENVCYCPYGKVGDILWVRETWGNYSYDEPESNVVYFMYRADYPDNAKGYWYEPEQINWCDLPRWRPSIHMPRKACRIRLRITDVKVERLQDITKEDAKAEGIAETEIVKAYNSIFKHKGGFADDVAKQELTRLFGTDNEYIYTFKNLWNSVQW